MCAIWRSVLNSRAITLLPTLYIKSCIKRHHCKIRFTIFHSSEFQNLFFLYKILNSQFCRRIFDIVQTREPKKHRGFEKKEWNLEQQLDSRKNSNSCVLNLSIGPKLNRIYFLPLWKLTLKLKFYLRSYEVEKKGCENFKIAFFSTKTKLQHTRTLNVNLNREQMSTTIIFS